MQVRIAGRNRAFQIEHRHIQRISRLCEVRWTRLRCPENFVDDEAFAACSVQGRAARQPGTHVRCPWFQVVARVRCRWLQFFTRTCHAEHHRVIAWRVVDTHIYPVITDALVWLRGDQLNEGLQSTRRNGLNVLHALGSLQRVVGSHRAAKGRLDLLNELDSLSGPVSVSNPVPRTQVESSLVRIAPDPASVQTIYGCHRDK
jgi:hypothetical protein